MSRVNSGPITIDDDWPGVFIRGDEAIGLALFLEGLASAKGVNAETYVRLLRSAWVSGLDADGVQVTRVRRVNDPDA